MRIVRSSQFAFLFVLCVAASSLYGGDFDITLQARSGDRRAAAHNGQKADEHGSRPLISSRPGDSLRIDWSVVCHRDAEALRDMTVHFFVVREVAIGQKETPKPDGGSPFETLFTADFKPGSESSAGFVLQAPAAGDYLMRIETIGAGRQVEFAAMDLRVQ